MEENDKKIILNSDSHISDISSIEQIPEFMENIFNTINEYEKKQKERRQGVIDQLLVDMPIHNTNQVMNSNAIKKGAKLKHVTLNIGSNDIMLESEFTVVEEPSDESDSYTGDYLMEDGSIERHEFGLCDVALMTYPEESGKEFTGKWQGLSWLEIIREDDKN